MNWLIFLILSGAAFLATSTVSLCLMIRKQEGRGILSPFHTMFAGVLLSVFIALLPVAHETLNEMPNSLRVILFTFQETMQVFTINVDGGMILENVRTGQETLNTVYSTYISFLFVAAPLLTFGFLISIFNSIKGYRKYLTHYRQDVYAFSEVNEKSVSLARSLKKNHPEAVLVFADVKAENDEWAAQADSIGAIRFHQDLLSIGFDHHSSRAQLAFFAISEDETENIRLGLKVIESYRQRKNTSVYVVSAGLEGELLFSNTKKGEVKVRRVNEMRNLIYRGLYDHGTDLFDHALPIEDRKKKIGAVLVGLGRHGTEMLKALSWYGQMDGYVLEIDAFDKNPQAADRIAAQCPELLSEVMNGNSNLDDACYTIRIHSGMDVETKAFPEALAQLPETTYVLVALGSDELNLRAAVAVRQQFERMKLKHQPVIQAIIYSTEEKNGLKDLKNFRGQAYYIDFIGDLEHAYSEEVLINSSLEQEALKGHRAWGEESEFWNYEYNYRSSMAVAIHRKAREYCGIPGADKTAETMTEAERAVIEPLEHRRWNAYMRSEGYIYSGSTERETRNDLGKMHHDLVGFSMLSEEDKRKNSQVGAKKE